MEHLHTAVGHGHGVIGGGVAGHLTVVSAAGWSHHVTRVHEIRTGRVASLLSPENTTGRLVHAQEIQAGVNKKKHTYTNFIKIHQTEHN